MRLIVVNKSTDLSNLGTQLFGNAGRKEATLQSMRRLNPHVDVNRIEPGTVMLVHEQPGLKDDATTSVTGEPFDEFRKRVGGALDATETKVRQGYEMLAAQREEVSAVLKTKAGRSLMSDPDLGPQLDAAALVFKTDQQHAKEAETMLKTLHAGSLAALDALARLLA